MALQELRTLTRPGVAPGTPRTVVLRTRDLPASAAWWADAGGLRILAVSATAIALGDPATGAPVLRLVPCRRAGGAPAGMRVSLLVAGEEDWERSLVTAAARGHRVLRLLDHGTERAFHLAGPDGLEVAVAVRQAGGRRRGAVAVPSMAIDPRGVLGDGPGRTGEEPVALGGVHLPVGDLAAAVRFWTEEAGLVPVASDERSAFFSPVPGGDPCVSVSTHHGAPAPDAPGVAALVVHGEPAELTAPCGLRLGLRR